MYGLMIVIYLFICVALVISILLQSAKGEGLAGAFGGSSLTGTVFGGRGAATFLSKATAYLGTAFMVFAIVLTFMHPTSTTAVSPAGSAVEEAARESPAPPPAEPGPEGQLPAGQQSPGQQPAGQSDADQGTPIEDLFDGQQQQQQAEPAQPGDTAR